MLGYELPLPGDRDLEELERQPKAPEHEHREEHLENIPPHVLTYHVRYDGGEVPELYEVGNQVMVGAHPQSDAKKNCDTEFHLKWSCPYNIRELHSGRVYTVDRRGNLVRVPTYDVKPASRPLSPLDQPRSPLSTIEEIPSDQEEDEVRV